MSSLVRSSYAKSEAYAAQHGIELKSGWKVDLARTLKQRLLP